MNAVRLPSFALAATTSGLILVVFILLIMIDHIFLSAIILTSIDLGWSLYTDLDQEALDKVDAVVGGRWWLVVALGLLAMVSTAVMLGRLLLGTSGRRNSVAILTAIMVVAGWLGFLMQFERVLDFSIDMRIKRQIPELQALAQRLRADWPEHTVEIPPYGVFGRDHGEPDMLMVAESEILTPFSWLGAIQKHGDAILFDFAYSSGGPWSIEFHQGTTTPESFTVKAKQAFYRHELDSFKRIDEGVYLSQYHESIEFENGEVIEILWE